MKRDVFIVKTSRYISIVSNLLGRLGVVDPKQIVSYLDIDVSNSMLGNEVKKKLAESREITEEVFMYYWKNNSEIELFNSQEEKRIKEKYGYRNRKSIYKDSIFLSVSIYNNMLKITPLHQDGLGSYTSVRNKEGVAIKFEYSVNLLLFPEELGNKIIEAFKYSTSIYK
ncbi:contact-dependent growth inhibition system immunity protein [Pasteurella sp. PK-2025]|uniref:contact-dependent growth inhibition system immunity protein n=1 Tax=Pasteurella sp. PK-2025 TaxID=3413133 RepID=UPI003C77F18F